MILLLTNLFMIKRKAIKGISVQIQPNIATEVEEFIIYGRERGPFRRSKNFKDGYSRVVQDSLVGHRLCL